MRSPLLNPLLPMETISSPDTATTTGDAVTTSTTDPGGPSVARKRRRQILESQRRMKAAAEPNNNNNNTNEQNDVEKEEQLLTMTGGVGARSEEHASNKKQCLSHESSTPVPDMTTSTAVIKSSPPMTKLFHSTTSNLSDAIPNQVFSAPRKISESENSATTTTRTTTTTSSSKRAKRPQMRYEPDVPMTKEQAAAWRREQRRKRNRESAAASRQRQRDRIAELELEVEEWKEKFQAAFLRLEELERQHGIVKTSTEHTEQVETNQISPCPSPNHIAQSMESSTCSEISNSFDSVLQPVGIGAGKVTETELYLKEKISRPAVKITGTVSPSKSNPSPNPTSCPNSRSKSSIENVVVSEVHKLKTHYGKDCPPTPSSPTHVKDVDMGITCPVVLEVTDEQLEFDKFLMDAAEWL